MNIFKILANLAEVDPEAYQRLSARRGMLSSLGQLGRRAAVTAAPLGLGAVLQTAYGRTTQTVLDTFTLALTLEYLENDFYSQALAAGRNGQLTFAPGTQAVIQQIQSHEQAHVDFLQRELRNSGAVVPAKPSFDFTGSKNKSQAAVYPNVFTNFSTFLKVAQLLEDTGVRAYKGQLAFLMQDNDLLQAAMQIHAVEARHAAHIRGMRRALGANVRDWVSKSDEVITTAGKTDAVYAGEDVTEQQLPLLPVRIFPDVNSAIVTSTKEKALLSLGEAFDEPITGTVASQLASLFIY